MINGAVARMRVLFVDVAFVPSEVRCQDDCICILVDVLRASSTIVTLFEKGVSIILPATSLRQARCLAREHGYILVGERDGLVPPGFDFGNSPTELIDTRVSEQGAILATSNGTAALRRLSGARAVFIGCMMNATACCERALTLAHAEDTYLDVVCAGQKGSFVLDDSVCAGFLVETLVHMVRSRGEDCLLSDAALGAQKLYYNYGDILSAFRESASGRRIVDVGQEADLALCASRDVSQVVPILTQSAPLQIRQLI